MITEPSEFMQQLQAIQDSTSVTYSTLPSDEPRFIIDANTRSITIPPEFQFLGVKNDHKAETVYFEIDRYFDTVDLSTHTCVVQFSNSSNSGLYPVTVMDTETVDGKIIFGWEIMNDVTAIVGNINFSVRFYSVDENSQFIYNFNTLTANSVILDTLDVDNPGVVENYPSELEAWLDRMNDLSQNVVKPEDVQALDTKMDTLETSFGELETNVNSNVDELKSDLVNLVADNENVLSENDFERGHWYGDNGYDANGYFRTKIGIYIKGVYFINNSNNYQLVLVNETNGELIVIDSGKRKVLYLTENYKIYGGDGSTSYTSTEISKALNNIKIYDVNAKVDKLEKNTEVSNGIETNLISLVSNNVINPLNIIDGYLINVGTNGYPYNSDEISKSYCYTDFISVGNNTKVYADDNTFFINFYSTNSFDGYISTTVTDKNGVNIPPNTEYIIASFPTVTKYKRFISLDKQNIVYGKDRVVECGEGKEFTRLRDAIECGVNLGCKVVVYNGLYDLVKEFSEEIARQGEHVGIELGNSVEITFLAGSYVKANFPNDNEWATYNFEPLFSFGRLPNNDFIINGLNIECTNTRYCVHDENNGWGVQHHVYRDCIMKYTNTRTRGTMYSQCIGGGMGWRGYIEIDGGEYTSVPNIALGGYSSAEESQIPISYHNGGTDSCDGRIVIKDVYLADKGHFRFGDYGPSTILSKVLVSGCSMGAEIEHRFENYQSTVTNFEITEWNNTIRN